MRIAGNPSLRPVAGGRTPERGSGYGDVRSDRQGGIMRTRLLTALSVAVLLVAPHARALEPAPTDDFGRWINCDDDGDHGIRHCEERNAEWRAKGATIRVDGGLNGGASVVGWD